jgi:serine protease AprX
VQKPDIAAPGVNVCSTIPVPRGGDGRPVANPARGDIFARDSGTSMATPVVAGMAALLAQRLKQRGREPRPDVLRRTLMRAAQPLLFGREAVGRGRATLP